MSDPVDPPRKFYKFKPKEFENVNGVTRDDLTRDEQPAADPGIVENDKVRIDVRDLLRAAQVEPPKDTARLPRTSLPAPTSDPGERIDVRELSRVATRGQPLLTKERTREETEIHDVLRGNHAKADQAGLNHLAPRERRPSRRKRDYLITMILGNIALLVGTAISPVFGAAGLIIFNLGITWIMWFIMDDY